MDRSCCSTRCGPAPAAADPNLLARNAYIDMMQTAQNVANRYELTLATELRERRARYGVLGVCVESGQGVALVLENTAQ